MIESVRELDIKDIRLCIYFAVIIVQVACRESREYCQWETFNATCSHDQLIVMQTARYGRMRFGRCMREDHGSVGCSADVLPYLDRRCSGRQTCQLTIPDATLHAIHPCPKELMPYLEASYICVRVAVGNRHACALSGGQPLKATSGFLSASRNPIQLPAGTRTCPWMIHVNLGQRVNLTLFTFTFGDPDFQQPSETIAVEGDADVESVENSRSREGVVSVAPYQMLHQSSVPHQQQQLQLVVRERGKMYRQIALGTSAAGEKRRERLLYSSETNEIDIYIHSPSRVIDSGRGADHEAGVEVEYDESRNAAVDFLIKYQVVGCPDIIEPADARVERHGETAVIKCNFTSETFYVMCFETKWKGELANCMKASPSVSSGQKLNRITTYNQGMLIVIGIGVVLGVSLGAIALLAVLLCLRRSKRDRLISASAPQAPLLIDSGEGCTIHRGLHYTFGEHVDDRQWTSEKIQSKSIHSLCPYHQRLTHMPTASVCSNNAASNSYRTEILYESPNCLNLLNSMHTGHPTSLKCPIDIVSPNCRKVPNNLESSDYPKVDIDNFASSLTTTFHRPDFTNYYSSSRLQLQIKHPSPPHPPVGLVLGSPHLGEAVSDVPDDSSGNLVTSSSTSYNETESPDIIKYSGNT